MKTAIVASLIASVAAFAPSKDAARTSVATSMAFESELGAQPPFGFFDPLGLVSDGDQEKFDRLRYVEIKHGRICMLGVVGYLLTEGGTRLPGLISFSGTKFTDIPSGFDALTAIPTVGLAQIVAFIGFLELSVMKSVPGTGNEFVGDFRNGYIDYGWDFLSEDAKLQKRAIELNQGRAAQMGLLGLMVHEKLGVSILPEGAVH
jgi:Chlorophyll A-B binding protein